MNLLRDIKDLPSRLGRGILSPNGNLFEKKPEFKVLVAVCTHRDIKAQVFELIRSLEPCPNPKIHVKAFIGDALIDRMRSVAASRFVEWDYDVLLFLDDDIVGTSLDITKILWTLWKYDFDVLAAPYPLKSESPREKIFAVRTLEWKDVIRVGEGAKIHPMRYVSTGCMAIKKRVFQKMIDENVVPFCSGESRKFWPFFMPMVVQDKDTGAWNYLSEDWSFCERALNLGFKIWCDFEVKLGHIGPKIYTWDDWFRPPIEPKKTFNYNVDVVPE